MTVSVAASPTQSASAPSRQRPAVWRGPRFCQHLLDLSSSRRASSRTHPADSRSTPRASPRRSPSITPLTLKAPCPSLNVRRSSRGSLQTTRHSSRARSRYRLFQSPMPTILRCSTRMSRQRRFSRP